MTHDLNLLSHRLHGLSLQAAEYHKATRYSQYVEAAAKHDMLQQILDQVHEFTMAWHLDVETTA